VLIESGSEGNCIDQNLVKWLRIPTKKIAWPILVYNANGQPNSAGLITHFATLPLWIHDHLEWIWLAIVSLGNTEIFLGHNWLYKHTITQRSIGAKEPLISPTATTTNQGNQTPRMNHHLNLETESFAWT
jgi:hypothetical protein